MVNEQTAQTAQTAQTDSISQIPGTFGIGQFSTKGAYFTIGMYIAMKEESEQYWRISRMFTKGSYTDITLQIVEVFTDQQEAIKWMYSQSQSQNGHFRHT